MEGIVYFYSMEQELALLRKQIFALHPLSEEEWTDFSAIWQPVQYKRKTILTTAGETERYLYFVTEGVQRAFYIDDHHPEATVVFSYAPSFSGIVDSFLTQQPSRYFLETLTSSKMLRTTYQQVQQLMDKHHNIERWVRLSVSWVIMGLLERQIELLSYSAEEKFRILLKRSPHVLQLIPHKYLASYMGIDASTFSKLLGTVRL
jgi:CRP-like cAMP-binding protein